MANSTIPIAATSQSLDSEQLTVGANTVQRERMEIAGAAAADIAVIMNSAPTGTEYGLVVRLVGGVGAVPFFV